MDASRPRSNRTAAAVHVNRHHVRSANRFGGLRLEGYTPPKSTLIASLSLSRFNGSALAACNNPFLLLRLWSSGPAFRALPKDRKQ